MSRLLNLILIITLLLLSSHLSAGSRAILGVAGGPRSVLTIDYGEPVKGIAEGDYFVLKVLKVRGSKVDYGFVRLEVEE